MTDFHVIIPARYESTRLPAKALVKIGSKAMITHVCERANESGASSVTVATDHQLIFDEVVKHGYTAVMTSESHPSGSDRVYEAAELIGLTDNDVIVNVQGDEPFIPPKNISLVASLIDNDTFSMSTLCCAISRAEEVLDPNVVKVIFDKNDKAIYFSRSVIPFSRDTQIVIGSQLPADYYRHIGIYAYSKLFLKQYINWQTGQFERIESLEQLRVIENGHAIKTACLDEAPPHGVDTQADLDKVREYYSLLSTT
jgi:3-deoxy-manno-octulosonate cytidylyltransferase (CMP-KDO synthetase)